MQETILQELRTLFSEIIAQSSAQSSLSSSSPFASLVFHGKSENVGASANQRRERGRESRSSQYSLIVRVAIMEYSSHCPDSRNEAESYARDYKDDLRISVQLNVWTLKPIGTWPRSADRFWIETLYRKALNIGCYGLLALLLIPSCMYIVLEIKDFYNQLKFGSAISFFMMAVIKYCALILREDDIRRCVKYIESDWRNVRHTEDRKIMLENASFGRRLVIICSVFMYGGVLFYFVAVPLSRSKIIEEEGNVTYRKLVFPVPKAIVDARRSPVNEIFYCIQLLAGIIAHNITVAACGLAALLAMHACGQLQVLMSWLNHLVDGREDVDDTVDERLASILRMHVRILK